MGTQHTSISVEDVLKTKENKMQFVQNVQLGFYLAQKTLCDY